MAPSVGVEKVVTQVVEGAAVKLVRTRARNERELPARSAAVFRGISRALDAKFLQRVHRDQTLRRAQCAGGAYAAGTGRLGHPRAVPRTDVARYAIILLVVCLSPLPTSPKIPPHSHP